MLLQSLVALFKVLLQFLGGTNCSKIILDSNFLPQFAQCEPNKVLPIKARSSG